jgi:hypothetical protein
MDQLDAIEARARACDKAGSVTVIAFEVPHGH